MSLVGKEVWGPRDEMPTSWPDLKRRGVANLPAGLEREAGDRHPVDGAARAWSHTWLVLEAFTWAVAATSELNNQSLTHELGSI